MYVWDGMGLERTVNGKAWEREGMKRALGMCSLLSPAPSLGATAPAAPSLERKSAVTCSWGAVAASCGGAAGLGAGGGWACSGEGDTAKQSVWRVGG